MKGKYRELSAFLAEREAENFERFKGRVREIEARQAYFRELEKLNPSLATISERFSAEKAKTKKPSITSILAHERSKPIFSADLVKLGLLKCPDPVRSLWLKYKFGHGSVAYSDVPEVEGVRNGYIGWEDLPEVENDETGDFVNAGLSLVWQATLPSTAIYEFQCPAQALVTYDYEVDGSGLWGLDASLEVVYSTQLIRANDAGYQMLVDNRSSILIASSSSTFGSTEIGYFGGGWFNVVGNGFFEGEKDDYISLVVKLQIYTWTGNGKVEIDVTDFFIPSVTGDDIIRIRD